MATIGFTTGGGWNIPTDMERARLACARKNAEYALMALRNDLEQYGVRVCPGLVAAAQESQVITTGPWEWTVDAQGLSLISMCLSICI